MILIDMAKVVIGDNGIELINRKIIQPYILFPLKLEKSSLAHHIANAVVSSAGLATIASSYLAPYAGIKGITYYEGYYGLGLLHAIADTFLISATVNTLNISLDCSAKLLGPLLEYYKLDGTSVGFGINTLTKISTTLIFAHSLRGFILTNSQTLGLDQFSQLYNEASTKISEIQVANQHIDNIKSAEKMLTIFSHISPDRNQALVNELGIARDYNGQFGQIWQSETWSAFFHKIHEAEQEGLGNQQSVYANSIWAWASYSWRTIASPFEYFFSSTTRVFNYLGHYLIPGYTDKYHPLISKITTLTSLIAISSIIECCNNLMLISDYEEKHKQAVETILTNYKTTNPSLSEDQLSLIKSQITKGLASEIYHVGHVKIADFDPNHYDYYLEQVNNKSILE